MLVFAVGLGSPKIWPNLVESIATRKHVQIAYNLSKEQNIKILQADYDAFIYLLSHAFMAMK